MGSLLRKWERGHLGCWAKHMRAGRPRSWESAGGTIPRQSGEFHQRPASVFSIESRESFESSEGRGSVVRRAYTWSAVFDASTISFCPLSPNCASKRYAGLVKPRAARSPPLGKDVARRFR